MFLAILGEAQAAVRDAQQDAKATGTAQPEYGIFAAAAERWAEVTHHLAASERSG